MNKADRHIYLYAKGHYQKGDLIEDLKRIVGERSSVLPEYITIQDIIVVLVSITYSVMVTKNHFKDSIMDLILSLDPSEFWKISSLSDYDFSTALILKCLSIIKWTDVVRGEVILMDLGYADSNLLPLHVSSEIS